MMSFVFDVETTGFPLTPDYDKYYHWKETDKYEGSRILQISYTVVDQSGTADLIHNFIVRPRGFTVRATHIHGIAEARAAAKGKAIQSLYNGILSALKHCRYIIAHNAKFCCQRCTETDKKKQSDKYSRNASYVRCTLRGSSCWHRMQGAA